MEIIKFGRVPAVWYGTKDEMKKGRLLPNDADSNIMDLSKLSIKDGIKSENDECKKQDPEEKDQCKKEDSEEIVTKFDIMKARKDLIMMLLEKVSLLSI